MIPFDAFGDRYHKFVLSFFVWRPQSFELRWGVQYITGENLKAAWAKFSTLS
jgi:hypothetical protein